jgi:TolA-binding protein
MGACAANVAAHDDVGALRRDVAQLAQRQAMLQQKIEDMDARLLVLSRRLAPAAHSQTEPATPAAPAGIPVVKVVPTAAPTKAPRVSTEVALREPTPDEVEALDSSIPAKGFAEEPVDSSDFQAGVEAVSTGDIERGVGLLDAFVKANPRHPKADNALLMIGVARIQSGDPAAAVPYLERVLRDYPAGDAVPETLLRLGECQWKLKNPTAARAPLVRLVSDFPGSPLAREAATRLAAMGEGSGSKNQPRAARSLPSGH